VNITPERKETFDYSIPYSRSAVVVVAKGNVTDINGPTDLKGRTVGAISGGMDGEIPAKAIEKEHGAFKSFKGYAGYAEMCADMEIDRIEAAVAPDTAAANFIKDKPGVARIVADAEGLAPTQGEDRRGHPRDAQGRSARPLGQAVLRPRQVQRPAHRPGALTYSSTRSSTGRLDRR
jgi:ABC-type amino acid transport substrate-binding protein